jgi:hypothetical protein
MAGRIEGHVMVHRTESAGGSMGQVGSGNAAIYRPAKRCLSANLAFASARFLQPRQQRLLSAHDGIRAVRAIYPEPLTR